MPDLYTHTRTEKRLPQTVDAGIVLTAQERVNIDAVNASNAEPWTAGILTVAPIEFNVWPWRHEADGTLIVGGKCPLCGRHHAHPFENSNPWRRPECSDAIPPFDAKIKPDSIRLRIHLDPIPGDIAFALEQSVPDVLTLIATIRRSQSYSARMLAIDGALQTAKKRRVLAMHEIKATTRTLIDTGYFDERIGIEVNDGEANLRAAERRVAARFIRAQGPGPMRARLVRALAHVFHRLGDGRLA